MGAGVWMACTLSLKDLGQANADASLSVDHLPLLGQNNGHLSGLGEKHCDHLFGSASQSL